MQNNYNDEKLNIYVKRSVSSGVKPIEVYFKPVYDCYGGEVIAYNVNVRVNSVISGVLNSNDYLDGAVDEQLLIKLTYRAISKVFTRKNTLIENSVPFKQIFIPCPTALAYADNLYESLKLIAGDSGLKNDGKLCLLFNASLMDVESDKIAQVFLDVRSVGFKVAVNGYGGSNFSIEKIISACPDYLFLDESVAALVFSREKKTAIAPLINLAKNLGAEVIANEISNDEELREFRLRECVGFVPSSGYKGVLTLKNGWKTVTEIISAVEGERYND